MAVYPVEALASAVCSLSDPSEKDGDVKGKGSEEGATSGETATVQELRKQVRLLQESLALANAEAEFFSREFQALRLRDRVLGVDLLTGNEEGLQNRLVQAVRELTRLEREREELVRCVLQLVDSAQRLLKSAGGIDPSLRSEFEVAVRSARQAVAGRGREAAPTAPSLQEVLVLHVNPELNSVILNAGERIGVKPGMPFRLIRNGAPIGRVRVFLTRENLSAALIEAAKEGLSFESGDRARIDAE